jgi:hypothetical protein
MSPVRDPPPTISAEDARGAEINLRTRPRRLIFLAGLIGFVLLAFVLGLMR